MPFSSSTATASLPAVVSDPCPDHRIGLDAIRRAAAVIDPVFLRSPQYRCGALEDRLGCRLTLKLETANPVRCFKGRGASLLVRSLGAAEDDAPLVSASAGNWGQALAHACGAAGRPLILFAAETANRAKVARMRALGAEVRLTGADFDAAKAAAEAHAAQTGGRFVADGRDVEASVGAGTIGIELTKAPEPFDVVLIPLGNGALATGVGRWIKAVAPSTRVVAVSAAGADSMRQSCLEGRPIVRPSVDTIADGLAVRVPEPAALADMAGTVDAVIAVDDAAMRAAMRLLFEAAGVVAEPAGAAGIAAMQAARDRFAGLSVAAIITGSNIAPDLLGGLVA